MIWHNRLREKMKWALAIFLFSFSFESINSFRYGNALIVQKIPIFQRRIGQPMQGGYLFIFFVVKLDLLIFLHNPVGNDQRCWIRNEHHWMLPKLLLFVSPTISSSHFLQPPLHPRLHSILDASKRLLYCCGTECSFASAYIPSFIMTFPRMGSYPFLFVTFLAQPLHSCLLRKKFFL